MGDNRGVTAHKAGHSSGLQPDHKTPAAKAQEPLRPRSGASQRQPKVGR